MGDVNFIPKERLAAKRRKARLRTWAAICGIYVVLLGAASVAGRVLCPTGASEVSEKLAAAAQQAKRDDDAITELRKTLAQATAALDTTQAMRGQPDWSKLFAKVSDVLSQEIVLGRCQLVTLTPDNKPVTEQANQKVEAKPLGAVLAAHRYELTLQGFGRTQESVSRFALGLENLGVFDQVRLASSSRQTFLDGVAVAFIIECRF
jgi:Tfp pilus assembly protein PilN